MPAMCQTALSVPQLDGKTQQCITELYKHFRFAKKVGGPWTPCPPTPPTPNPPNPTPPPQHQPTITNTRHSTHKIERQREGNEERRCSKEAVVSIK